MAVAAPGETLTVYSGGSAPMKLKFEELRQFQDNKGQRRQRFSRDYKQVDRLEVSPHVGVGTRAGIGATARRTS